MCTLKTEVLYLSHSKLSGLRTICSEHLVLSILEDYGHRHKVIIGNDDYPQGLWSVNHYLDEPGIPLESKVMAILAFAYLGGIIEFEDSRTVIGDMNVLFELLERGYINSDEYAFYTHLIYKARKGEAPLNFKENK